MINIVEKNIFETDNNFIVIPVCVSDIQSKITKTAFTLYPIVAKEYRKYLKHCRKYNKNPNATVQYVPKDVWAIGMVNTIQNKYIEAYDKNYQYIVNVFCEKAEGKKVKIQSEDFKIALIDICTKAKAVGGSVVIPYGIGQWNNILGVIEEVFGDIDVNVEICKFDY